MNKEEVLNKQYLSKITPQRDEEILAKKNNKISDSIVLLVSLKSKKEKF